MLLAPVAHGAGRYGPMPRSWHAPRWWLGHGPPHATGAWCIHSREGAWNASGGLYEGGMQFLRSTWVSVGGRVASSGHWASVASPREQLYRAWLVWNRDGRSWREWGTAGACGLR